MNNRGNWLQQPPVTNMEAHPGPQAHKPILVQQQRLEMLLLLQVYNSMFFKDEGERKQNQQRLFDQTFWHWNRLLYWQLRDSPQLTASKHFSLNELNILNKGFLSVTMDMFISTFQSLLQHSHQIDFKEQLSTRTNHYTFTSPIQMGVVISHFWGTSLFSNILVNFFPEEF